MSSQRAFKCSIEMHYIQDACTRASLCCWVFCAHPRDGVEGLWEDVVARLVSSPCFLKFLFIGNMSEWVRLCEKSRKPCRVHTWLWVLWGLPQSPGLLRAWDAAEVEAPWEINSPSYRRGCRQKDHKRFTWDQNFIPGNWELLVIGCGSGRRAAHLLNEPDVYFSFPPSKRLWT